MTDVRRFEYDGRIRQEKGQQFLSGRSLYNDGFTEIHQPQVHGFYSNPPKGSKGLLLHANDRSDEAYLLGIEHPDHQPTGINPGGVAIYDAFGQILKFVTSGMVVDTASKTITITSGAWTMTAPLVTINGNVQVNGNINLSGNIVAGGTIVDSDGNNGA